MALDVHDVHDVHVIFIISFISSQCSLLTVCVRVLITANQLKQSTQRLKYFIISIYTYISY